MNSSLKIPISEPLFPILCSIISCSGGWWSWKMGVAALSVIRAAQFSLYTLNCLAVLTVQKNVYSKKFLCEHQKTCFYTDFQMLYVWKNVFYPFLFNSNYVGTEDIVHFVFDTCVTINSVLNILINCHLSALIFWAIFKTNKN